MHESFIYQAYIEDLSLCDALIDSHEKSPSKKVGVVYNLDVPEVNRNVKDSEDSLLCEDIGLIYMQELQKVVDKYVAKYPQCNMGAPWVVVQTPQIQKYKPNGGFFNWHFERNTGTSKMISSRHLVFMTYLNDVTDGGETEFQLQNLKVQPRKGLTLIWPADWTHTHRGITSPTQEKYIVTGWFNYV
jgi:hypothetical protein